MLNDNELIVALHREEASAYDQVYEKFARQLRFFIGQLIPDNAAAEDIAVETFTKAFDRTTDFSSLDKLKAFLFITASNASLDYLRHEKIKSKAEAELRYLQDAEMKDAEFAYITAEATRAVHQAIQQLPDRPRQVIQLLFIEGKKLTEVAEQLKISYNTVQEYRARGISQLRIKLVDNKSLGFITLFFALSLLEQQ